jgi:hypothetical protein
MGVIWNNHGFSIRVTRVTLHGLGLCIQDNLFFFCRVPAIAEPCFL